MPKCKWFCFCWPAGDSKCICLGIFHRRKDHHHAIISKNKIPNAIIKMVFSQVLCCSFQRYLHCSEQVVNNTCGQVTPLPITMMMMMRLVMRLVALTLIMRTAMTALAHPTIFQDTASFTKGFLDRMSGPLVQVAYLQPSKAKHNFQMWKINVKLLSFSVFFPGALPGLQYGLRDVWTEQRLQVPPIKFYLFCPGQIMTINFRRE